MGLFNRIKANAYLGVDIGTTSIKAAQLEGSKRTGFTLTNYALVEATSHLERYNSALQSSNLKLLDSDVIAYLKLLRAKGKFKTNVAVASLPAFAGFTTLLELPMMNSREVNQSIHYQAKNYVPIPISTVTLDWLKVGEKTEADGSKKQQIFLISIPNETIEKYSTVFKAAGFELAALELEGISAARILSLASKEPVLIVDIGGRSTSLTVAQEEVLKFSGQTDFSSGSLTQTLATALNIGTRRAEDLKRATRLAAKGGEQELSTIMLPIVDVIINEGKRVIAGFEQSYRQKVSGILLAGSGSNLEGLSEYVANQTGLPAKVANPFDYIAYPPELEPLKSKLGSTLTVAIGLSLKNI